MSDPEAPDVVAPDLKTEMIVVRLTPAEKEKLDVIARCVGVSKAEVLRQTLGWLDVDYYKEKMR